MMISQKTYGTGIINHRDGNNGTFDPDCNIAITGYDIFVFRITYDRENGIRVEAVRTGFIGTIMMIGSSCSVDFIQATRKEELYKLPGIAETLDWAEALGYLHCEALNTAVVNATLGIILKYQDDVNKMQGQTVDTLLANIL